MTKFTNHLIKSFTVVLCCIIVQSSYAQSQLRYSNQQLAQLWSDLSVDSREIVQNPKNDQLYTIKYGNYAVVAQILDNSLLSHLGVDIFGDNLKQYQDSVVLNFVERYLLVLLLEEDSDSVDRKMKFDDVAISGDLNNIPIISSKGDISLSLNIEDEFYITEWSDKSSKFAIKFPVDFSFVSGCTKIELEESFAYGIQNHTYTKRSVEPSFSPVRVSKIGDDLYLYSAGDYIIEKLKYVQYLQKDNQKYSYLVDVQYPIETLFNLVTTPDIQSSIDLDITQHRYGFKTQKYSCKLTDVIDFCISQGCTPYFGIESDDNDQIVATLIMVNHLLNYNHLLSFKVPYTVLSNLEGVVEVDINTYIPTHNLETIFDDNSQVDSKHDIKLDIQH